MGVVRNEPRGLGVMETLVKGPTLRDDICKIHERLTLNYIVRMCNSVSIHYHTTVKLVYNI